MPFVRRNAAGAIDAVFSHSDEAAQEFVQPEAAELSAFLNLTAPAPFSSMDAEFIRVMEDLIDTLISKGLLRLTDLPNEAQQKLLARKDLRRRMGDALDLFGDNDVI